MGIDIALEIERVHGEVGMSGGLVFKTDPHNDYPPTISPWSATSVPKTAAARPGPSLRVYAIPMQDVANFIYQTLAAPTLRSRIRQELRDQLRGPYDVLIGNYDFEFLEQNRRSRFPRAQNRAL